MDEPAMYKSLVERLHTGELTMKEFDMECSYWLIGCDLFPLPLPDRPDELYEYDNCPVKDRHKIPPSFWRQPKVYAFTEERRKRKERNKGLLKKLIEFKEYIPVEDTVYRERFDVAIRKFSGG